ncbi:MAG: germination protein YpeB [Clostridia bacterium]|nr:germination protein YpeB [Clostridia bacterium]
MRIKEKLKDFKNRLIDRHMYSVIVGLIIIFVAVFAYEAKMSADYKNQLNMQYSRAFNELVQHVSTIETNLAKGVVITDPKTMIRLSNDTYAKAASASSNLGQLPLSDVLIENTAKFLSQVGDFTYTLSLRYMDNPLVTDEEQNTMLSLSRYAVTLKDSLYELQGKVSSGEYQFKNPSKFGGAVALASGMEQIEKNFKDYPSLIYDGPFSDHVQTKESSLLSMQGEISFEEAQSRVPSIVSEERNGEIKYEGECGGRLPTYMFSVTPKNAQKNRRITLQLTKKGGMLLQMLDNRSVYEQKIEIDEAKAKASEYLSQHGIFNMQNSYFEIKNNIVTINYAYKADNVIYYPDLIKVKVALDSGEILGFEASGYIMNHTERQLPQTTLSNEEAAKKLSRVVNVENSQLCMIPTNAASEVYCWEFKCHVDEKTFLIYLNAETGREENVLMLLQTEGGMLTI